MNWEQEVRYNQARLRDEPSDPFVQLRKWRRRAIAGWLLALLFGLIALTER
jgi:hypothetical protein